MDDLFAAAASAVKEEEKKDKKEEGREEKKTLMRPNDFAERRSFTKSAPNKGSKKQYESDGNEENSARKRPKVQSRKHMWMEPPSVLGEEKHTRVGSNFQATIPELVAPGPTLKEKEQSKLESNRSV